MAAMNLRNYLEKLKKKNKALNSENSSENVVAHDAYAVDTSGVVDAGPVSEFPREYDPALGITRRDFDVFWKRSKTIFSSVGELDKAYQNIPESLLDKTEKTKAQVLLAYGDYVMDSYYFRAKHKGEIEKDLHVLELSKDDTKKVDAFKAMFRGEKVSEGDMKTIEDIVSTYVPGYVSKKFQYVKVESIDGAWRRIDRPRNVEIEPKLPRTPEPVPVPVSSKGNNSDGR